jgi:uncharacterized protein Yka (UPF0111/DUF47 family)
VNSVDTLYFQIYRKDLKKIINRINIGLDTTADISALIGIISMFLDSSQDELIEEAHNYIRSMELLQKYFPEIFARIH